MTIIIHLKIFYVITFLSCLIYWNLLSFSCSVRVFLPLKVETERILLTLVKFQLLVNYLPGDDKLTLNHRPSTRVRFEMLSQRHKVLG